MTFHTHTQHTVTQQSEHSQRVALAHGRVPLYHRDAAHTCRRARPICTPNKTSHPNTASFIPRPEVEESIASVYSSFSFFSFFSCISLYIAASRNFRSLSPPYKAALNNACAGRYVALWHFHGVGISRTLRSEPAAAYARTRRYKHAHVYIHANVFRTGSGRFVRSA